MPSSTNPGRYPRTVGRPGWRSLLAGALFGIGVASFLDEMVFHQLLRWHHFYDGAGPDVGLISDGLFHAGGWIATVVGLFLFADLQRRQLTVPRRVWSGGLLGWGGFQVYDGLFQHKVLRLHQIRYDVDLVPYDIAWNAVGAAAVVAGLVLLRTPGRSRRADTRQRPPIRRNTRLPLPRSTDGWSCSAPSGPAAT